MPVLKQTARDLEALRAADGNLNTSSIAAVIAHDLMMTVKLLRHPQQNKHRKQTTEAVQVVQADSFSSSGSMISSRPIITSATASVRGAFRAARRSAGCSRGATRARVMLIA